MKRSLALLIALLPTGGVALAQPAPSVGSTPVVIFTQAPAAPEPVATPFPVIEVPAAAPAECCDPTAYSPRVWGRAEFLLWGFKSSPVPAPLVTAGSVAPNLAPVLLIPGTTTVLGGGTIDTGVHSSGRFTLGYWFDDCQDCSAYVSYLFLGTRTDGKTVSSTGQPGSQFLALPFFNAATGTESSTRIALPGGFAGTANLANTGDMQAWELNGTKRLCGGDHLRFDLIGGFRYWNLNERLAFRTDSPSIIPPIDVFGTLDQFDCRNYFYGGQFGAQVEFRWNRVFLRTQGKVAIGAMHDVVVTNGQLVTNDFNGVGAPQTFPAGYLGMPTNNGKITGTRFAVLPEVDLNLGVQVTRRISLLVGYTFLYANNVTRPGDQIDRIINPTQAPAITGVPSTTVVGVPRPAPQFNTSDFWAQGLNLGLEVRY
jgi:hypothetical protein